MTWSMPDSTGPHAALKTRKRNAVVELNGILQLVSFGGGVGGGNREQPVVHHHSLVADGQIFVLIH